MVMKFFFFSFFFKLTESPRLLKSVVKNYAGVKEDIFFDSQPWLDSDCEEFFSVCGGKNISV